ncbi:MAG TPA: PH domain-containing protein [Candidatus Saccharimonadales bacterium]|nr:PH domain-containing protein [Candidatus Saccharimonadales bacterium]
MVTKQSIDEQLKKIRFNLHGWGRTEISELPNIILPDEQIYECVNGIYEGGFALLVATNIRVLLIDKKPLNYLTVEDLRFDMINEIDYSHRLMGAQIRIATGSKTLRFTSYNQQRLRKLINHVQHCMAEIKLKQSEHQEDQNLHLEQINRQLQAYLLAQHQQQQKLHEQLQSGAAQPAERLEPVKPSPELSDYLYAQSLLAQHEQQTGQDLTNDWSGNGADGRPITPPIQQLQQVVTARAPAFAPSSLPPSDELYAEGVQEVFGRRAASQPEPRPQSRPQSQPAEAATNSAVPAAIQHALDINPLRIAYSRLPMAMRNRRFGSPSFHAHSQSGADSTQTTPARA